MSGQLLPVSFYLRQDVVQIACDLLGKWLFSCDAAGQVTAGMVTETEAYRGPEDRACHAYQHRRTARTEVMYQRGGIAYVYLCYGIHHLLNVVTAPAGVPHAVLIRSLYPTIGIALMIARRAKQENLFRLAAGPGRVTQALQIDGHCNALPFSSSRLWIEDRGRNPHPRMWKQGRRIGIEYAAQDAHLPWRFTLQQEAVASLCLGMDENPANLYN